MKMDSKEINACVQTLSLMTRQLYWDINDAYRKHDKKPVDNSVLERLNALLDSLNNNCDELSKIERNELRQKRKEKKEKES